MHAVVVNLTITDPEAAERALHEQLVPRVSQAPGFVTGYWTRRDNTALFDVHVRDGRGCPPAERTGRSRSP
jgi:hypothetical protein